MNECIAIIILYYENVIELFAYINCNVYLCTQKASNYE